tara:strand:- start:87 stop:491 length:405 start_codon:yes stop_codon:yes gene_type:complete
MSNKEIKILFLKGVKKFNDMEFYDAHDYFEEIWSDYKINNRLYLQAMIQLSVAYFHISNDNKNGGCSLLKKAIEKFEKFNCFTLDDSLKNKISIQNIDEITSAANKSYKHILSIDDVIDFDWSLAPKIILIHGK